ncbi:DUF3515 domain-containing protein [Nocardioides sp. Bht2]|uniref:DUF3515 domain-containing protein n=1 Tax=Nocardioides sp. Bht2 TaxID=3392297 RepID=UPI0039B5BAEB
MKDRTTGTSRRARASLPAALLTALSIVTLSACSNAVDVDAPRPPAADERACRALLDALPDSLDGDEERETDPADALARAWGDPATIVTCGVDMPAAFNDYSACDEVNGVGWFIDPDQAGSPDSPLSMTTIGITPNVRLDVPAERRPPAGVLSEVSTAVLAHLKQVKRCV